MAEPLTLLKHAELFAPLPADALRKIAALGIRRRFLRGNLVFLEGDAVDGLYLVLAGAAKLYQTGTDGREHILRRLGPGDLCAEAVVFAADTFPVSCAALTDSELLFLPKARFLALLRHEPGIALELLVVLSRRVQYLVRKVEDLSLREVSARLARALLDQARLAPEGLRPGQLLKLELPKHALAASLGTIPATLSRTLTKMGRKKTIRTDRGRIVILDPAGLERLADGEKL